MKPPVDPASFPALYKHSQQAYRDAIAAQIRGDNPTEAWDEWEADTAAMLIAAWVSGALVTLDTAKVKPAALQVFPTQFDRGDIDAVTLRFQPGPAREVIKRFRGLLPMTRDRWEALIAHAFEAAGELRDTEAADALDRILERSPRLAAVVRGQADAPPPQDERLPEEVRKRRTPAVQAVAQGAFFVTGMSQEQVEATRDLVAQAVRGEVTRSVAGKRLEELGVGDFVEQATLDTGTDLTAARLETVYRTNINRAQSQGRLDIVRDPTVQRFVPLMRFNATKDRRTRETHKAMDGFIATVAQIDGWGIPTPLGFNCRCSWSPVSIATAVTNGWCDDDGQPDYEAIKRHNGARQRMIDKGLVPDSGFISG